MTLEMFFLPFIFNNTMTPCPALKVPRFSDESGLVSPWCLNETREGRHTHRGVYVERIHHLTYLLPTFSPLIPIPVCPLVPRGPPRPRSPCGTKQTPGEPSVSVAHT